MQYLELSHAAGDGLLEVGQVIDDASDGEESNESGSKGSDRSRSDDPRHSGRERIR